MKKFIFLIVALFALTSCYDYSAPQVETRDAYVKTIVYKYEYEGHKYQSHYVDPGHGYSIRHGIIHDPDCPCHNDSVKKGL